jgi:hypothetical protein
MPYRDKAKNREVIRKYHKDHPEEIKRNIRKWVKGHRLLVNSIQRDRNDKTRPKATMNKLPWGEVEDAVLCDETLTDMQRAAKCGRTLAAVRNRRHFLEGKRSRG